MGDQKGSAAMLRSVAVTPEAHLGNPLHAGSKACKWGNHPGSEIQSICHQKPKTGVSVAPQKVPMSSRNSIKNNFWRVAPSSVSKVFKVGLGFYIAMWSAIMSIRTPLRKLLCTSNRKSSNLLLVTQKLHKTTQPGLVKFLANCSCSLALQFKQGVYFVVAKNRQS